jgi:hypothetical protein
MASTFSTNLALELIGTGDQAGSWGNTTNTNLGTLIEQAISGYVTQAMTTGNTTSITIPDGASGVARNMFIELTGTGGTNTVLAVPANKKLYFIYNNTSGAVTVKVGAGTGVSVAAAEKQILVSNGTDVVKATSYITSGGSISFDSLSVTTLTATSANITTLTGTSMNVTTATHASANITQLQSTSATITTLTGTSANITTLTGTSMNVTTATHASANITTLSGTNFSATSLTLTNPLTNSQGGTGLSTAPTNGQLLIGNGSGYTLSTLTAGTGLSVTNATGSITIAASGGGLPTVTVTASTAITAAANFHYILTAATAATVTLPASPTISDTIYVTVANSLVTNVVARNGKPIQSIAEDLTLNSLYASAQLRFTNDTVGWVLA